MSSTRSTRTERSVELRSSTVSQGTAEVDERAGFHCDLCGRHFTGAPGGSGLLLWARGEDVRFEEPPLCRRCAAKVTYGALYSWDVEPEDE